MRIKSFKTYLEGFEHQKPLLSKAEEEEEEEEFGSDSKGFKHEEPLLSTEKEKEEFGLDIEKIVEEIDEWIESNSDYISAYSLEDKIKELLDSDEVETTEETIRKEGKYGEDWSTKVICVKYKGKDLMKVCVNSSGRYDFGKNSIMFEEVPLNKKHTAGVGVRFFFDKNVIN